MDKQQIAAELKARRKSLGLTQQQMAEHLGIPFQHIPPIEKGVTNYSIERLIEMCDFLKLEVRIKPLPKQPKS